MSGPLIVPSSPSITGISLGAYVRDLAETIGLRQRIRVQATVGGEARRWIVSDDLKDDDQTTAELAGWYASVSDGAEAGVTRRIVADEGYEGPVGAVRVSRPFSTTLATGTNVELTWPLPWRSVRPARGLVDVVNEALALVRIEARLDFTGDGTAAYALDAHPWLFTEAQVNGVYEPAPSTADNPYRVAYPYAFRQSGSARYLETYRAYSSTETFGLSVLVAGSRLIRQNGIWGYSDGGLVSDDDEAAVPLHWVRAFGAYRALRHLEQLAARDPAIRERLPSLEADRQHWAATALRIRRFEFPLPQPTYARSLIAGSAATYPPEVLPAGPWYP